MSEDAMAAIAITIDKLRRVRFVTDAILDSKISLITSICSSALKRHGKIIEIALREALCGYGHYKVWTEDRFFVSRAAMNLVDSQSEEDCLVSTLPYPSVATRKIQIDLLAFDETRGFLGAYEVKRGGGHHDSGKTRSITTDMLVASLLLKGYAHSLELQPTQTQVKLISYYGAPGTFSKHLVLKGSELNDHFQCDVASHINKVNEHFKMCINNLLIEKELIA